MSENTTSTTKGRLIQFKQGARANLPTLKVGEPGFCTDDFTFWIGSETGNKQIAMIDDIPSANIGDGSVSFQKLDSDLQTRINAFITINDIPIASSTRSGLMSEGMFTKLTNIETQANKTVVVNNLDSMSTTEVLSAYQGKVLKDMIASSGGGGGSVTIPDATTTVKGIVKLNANINSNSELEAATPSAVKRAYDLAKKADDKVFKLDNTYQRDLTTTNTSTAFGYKNNITGEFSFAVGNNNTVSGNFANAFNSETTAHGENSTSFGDNTNAGVYASLVMGINNKDLSGSPYSYNMGSDSFVIGNGNPAEGIKGNAFRVNLGGSVYGLSAFNSSGADYAEYFEWLDGNVLEQDRRGYVVTLDGEKVRKATKNDNYILGIVSANPSVIGDSHQDDWSGKYLRDEWGKILTVKSEVKGVIVEEPLYNPEWDSSVEYVPRENRKEWSPIGMVGKLLVRDDGTCIPNGYCKVGDVEGELTFTEDITNIRVLKRVSDTIIQVLIK